MYEDVLKVGAIEREGSGMDQLGRLVEHHLSRGQQHLAGNTVSILYYISGYKISVVITYHHQQHHQSTQL